MSGTYGEFMEVHRDLFMRRSTARTSVLSLMVMCVPILAAMYVRREQVFSFPCCHVNSQAGGDSKLFLVCTIPNWGGQHG
jgi:hypothetical protein